MTGSWKTANQHIHLPEVLHKQWTPLDRGSSGAPGLAMDNTAANYIQSLQEACGHKTPRSCTILLQESFLQTSIQFVHLPISILSHPQI